MEDKDIKNINQFFENLANINSEKILESILPSIREAIAKSYKQGFMTAMKMNKYKQQKNGNNI